MSSTSGYGSINVCINPSFETDTTAWSNSGWYVNGGATIARSSSQYKYGSYSLAVTPNGSMLAEGTVYAHNGGLNIGDLICASLHFYPTAAATYQLYLYDTINGNMIAQNSVVISGTNLNQWNRINCSATATTTVATGNLRLSFRSYEQISQVFYVDGVMLEWGTTSLNDFFDGSFGYGYRWTGVAHASPTRKMSLYALGAASCKAIGWGTGAYLTDNQGGSLELGDATIVGSIPFIDFHYGTGTNQDYNVRLINDADGTLDFFGSTFKITNATFSATNTSTGIVEPAFRSDHMIGTTGNLLRHLISGGGNDANLTHTGWLVDYALEWTGASYVDPTYFLGWCWAAWKQTTGAYIDLMRLSNMGQLQLPIQGSSGGLLIGGDVQLYRSATNVLKTDDSLKAAGTIEGTGIFTHGVEAGSWGFVSSIDGETATRLIITCGGTIIFGDGAGVYDVNLYRACANELKTDDNFTVGGFDFVLGTGDQSSRGNTGASRALVKDNNGVLTINYGSDFYGGVKVDSKLSSLNNTLDDGSGNMIVNGNLVQQCYAPVLSNFQLVAMTYGYFYNGSTSEPVWQPERSGTAQEPNHIPPRDDGVQSFLPGSGYLTFQNNISGSPSKYVNIFAISSKSIENNNVFYSPLLCIDQGLVVKKDIDAGGALFVSQGGILLGHGLDRADDPPKICLAHSANYLNGVASGTSFPSYPGELTLFIRTDYSPDLVFQYVNGTWVSLGSIDNWSGGWDTLYITKSGFKKEYSIPYTEDKLGNIKLNTLCAVKTEYQQSSQWPVHNIHAFENYLYYNNDAGTGGLVPGGSNLILGGPDVGGYTAPLPWRHIYGRWIHATDEINAGNLTGMGTRNVGADSNGKLVIMTSSKRYKTNISILEDCSWLFKLAPVEYEWKDKTRGEGMQLGLIAEEVHKVYPPMAWLDSEGIPEGVHYEWLGVPLLVEVKKLHERIEALEKQLKQIQTAS